MCPAPCEASCVLNMRDEPVTIKTIERTIADSIFAAGTARAAAGHRPQRQARRGRRVGPGRARGRAAARARRATTWSCSSATIGSAGLLRYGIPDFKMEKGILDARIEQMRAEGVAFRAGRRTWVSTSPASSLLARVRRGRCWRWARALPRDLPIPGRELRGVHFAMEFLVQQNRRIAGDACSERWRDPRRREARRRHRRRGHGLGLRRDVDPSRRGVSVTQLELMPKPALVRSPNNPWPEWPLVLRTSTSQEEGAGRDWAVSTRALPRRARESVVAPRGRARRSRRRQDPPAAGDGALDSVRARAPGHGLRRARADGHRRAAGSGARRSRQRPDATPAARRTSRGVFAAGDASRGQSLVVWAIADGRRVAAGVDASLRCVPAARAANG